MSDEVKPAARSGRMYQCNRCGACTAWGEVKRHYMHCPELAKMGPLQKELQRHAAAARWQPERPWFLWGRAPLRHVVAQLAHSDWAGCGYRFARVNGKIVRFWTKRAAQAFADKLNAEQANGHGAEVGHGA